MEVMVTLRTFSLYSIHDCRSHQAVHACSILCLYDLKWLDVQDCEKALRSRDTERNIPTVRVQSTRRSVISIIPDCGLGKQHLDHMSCNMYFGIKVFQLQLYLAVGGSLIFRQGFNYSASTTGREHRKREGRKRNSNYFFPFWDYSSYQLKESPIYS